MTNKICFKCEIEKPLTEFYKHAQMADGHVNKCKECNKKDVKKNYRINIEHYKEYEKNRCQTPERRERNLLASRKLRLENNQRKLSYNRKYDENNKDKKLAYRQEYIKKPEVKGKYKEYKKRNPEKIKARYAISNGLKKGTVIKSPCMVCGEVKSEAHHEDYNKPFEVIWLCAKHYSEHEKRKKY